MQGPLELYLCDRCAGDPFFADAGLLRSMDDLQALSQDYVRERGIDTSGSESRIKQVNALMADVHTLVSTHYPAVIGMGVSHITVAFGERIAAKLAWHGHSMDLRQRYPDSLLACAWWLTVSDELATHLCPLLVLSSGGVIWQVRAQVLGPASNPTIDQVPGVMFRNILAIQALTTRYRADILDVSQKLGITPFARAYGQLTDQIRLNNWGMLDGRLVALDLNMTMRRGREVDNCIKWLQDRDTDVSLDRAITRPLLENLTTTTKG